MSTTTLIDPDSFFEIAKNLDAKTLENFANTNRHYRRAYEQVKQHAYKYYLKRDFNYMMRNPFADAKRVYLEAYNSRPQVTVLFTFSPFPFNIDPFDLTKGTSFTLEKFSLEWLQTAIFESVEYLGVFLTRDNAVEVACDVYIDGYQRSRFYFSNRAMLSGTLYITVPQGQQNPIYRWKPLHLDWGISYLRLEFDDELELWMKRIEAPDEIESSESDIE